MIRLSQKEDSMKHFSCLLSTVFCILVIMCQASSAEIKNVIILIGDGMGFEEVRAASMYAYGQEGMLTFERFYRGEVRTNSADSYLTRNHATDSAAAATAMATGHKVNNGVISEEANEPLKTLLEYSKDRGQATGLITTVFLTDATPAGFGAHAGTRNNGADIAEDYIKNSRPNILFGAYYNNNTGMPDNMVRLAGYNIVKTRQQMLNAIAEAGRNSGKDFHIAGLFTPGQDMPFEYDYYRQSRMLFPYEGMNLLSYDVIPHLSEMTSAALNILDNNKDGFFLMVECGGIDHADHANVLERSVYAVLEFEQACVNVFNWMWDRDDTLVVVTADHETGGLKIIKNNGRGYMPDVFWGGTDHSGINVPIYATGQGAEEFVGVIDDTDIFKTIKRLTEK
jgi:alkaline phosphatase